MSNINSPRIPIAEAFDRLAKACMKFIAAMSGDLLPSGPKLIPSRFVGRGASVAGKDGAVYVHPIDEIASRHRGYPLDELDEVLEHIYGVALDELDAIELDLVSKIGTYECKQIDAQFWFADKMRARYGRDDPWVRDLGRALSSL